jgi:hypothetical protein
MLIEPESENGNGFFIALDETVPEPLHRPPVPDESGHFSVH